MVVESVGAGAALPLPLPAELDLESDFLTDASVDAAAAAAEPPELSFFASVAVVGLVVSAAFASAGLV